MKARSYLIGILALATVVANAAVTPQQAFEKLKALAGNWTGEPTAVTYRLTGAGSTLMETLFPGTGHEMVTMFHMDGDKLILTHYCAAQNQPTLRYIPGNDPNTLVFDFISGTNMKSSDMHMHHVTFHLLSGDHIKSEWQAMAGGKPAMTHKFDLHRSK